MRTRCDVRRPDARRARQGTPKANRGRYVGLRTVVDRRFDARDRASFWKGETESSSSTFAPGCEAKALFAPLGRWSEAERPDRWFRRNTPGKTPGKPAEARPRERGNRGHLPSRSTGNRARWPQVRHGRPQKGQNRKGPVTPIRATVAPFPAWRGSRFRVDRTMNSTRPVGTGRIEWLLRDAYVVSSVPSRLFERDSRQN